MFYKLLESFRISMFWRHLIAMFITSFLWILFLTIILTWYTHKELHRNLESNMLLNAMKTAFIDSADDLRFSKASTRVCGDVLQSISRRLLPEELLSKHAQSNIDELLKNKRFKISYIVGSRVFCSFPSADQTYFELKSGDFSKITNSRSHTRFEGQVINKAANGTVDGLVIDFMVPSPVYSLVRTPGAWLLLALWLGVINFLSTLVLAPLLTRRIKRARDSAQRWAGGDLRSRIVDKSNDEFGDLVTTFNNLADSLDDVVRVKQELAAATERNRLARDLHDSAKQRAFALSLQLATLKSSETFTSVEGKRITTIALHLLQQLQNDLSRIIKRYSASTIAQTDMEKLLIDEVGTMLQGSSIDWTINIPQPITTALKGRLDVAQQVFLIAIEAVANALKHSNTRSIAITLSKRENYSLSITDAGCGFDYATSVRSGMGLSNMKLRAISLPGGTFLIESSLGKGTTVTVFFCLDENEANYPSHR